jgi:molybdopterin-guanine dinucleotide biosynthesis protein A
MGSCEARFVLAGIFVGGASERMGGTAKGLLMAPGGESIVSRCCRVLAKAGVSEIVLVGRNPAYASFRLEAIDDRPAGVGPIGGILAMLEHARGAPCIAIACDMPYVTEALVGKMIRAPAAPVTAPRRAHRWEPLFARYDACVLPVARRNVSAGVYSLQRLLAEAGAAMLPISDDEREALDDWDTPEDVSRERTDGPTR